MKRQVFSLKVFWFKILFFGATFSHGQMVPPPGLSGLPPGFGGPALQSPAEAEYMRITDQLVRQFWSSLEIKVEQLKDTYAVQTYDGIMRFRSEDGLGCQKDNQTRGLKYVVAELRAFEGAKQARRDTYTVSFSSCDSQQRVMRPVYKEFIEIHHQGISPFTKDAILKNTRLFVANADAPKIVWKVFWAESSTQSSISIESTFGLDFAKTDFFIFGFPVVRIAYDKNKNQVRLSSLLSNENRTSTFERQFNTKLKLDSPVQLFNPPHLLALWKVQDFPQFRKEDGASGEEISKLAFVKTISESYGELISNTFKRLMTQLTDKMPGTEDISAVTADSRLFKELAFIEQKLRVASPQDIDFSRTLLRTILKALQDGEISVVDKRK